MFIEIPVTNGFGGGVIAGTSNSKLTVPVATSPNHYVLKQSDGVTSFADLGGIDLELITDLIGTAPSKIMFVAQDGAGATEAIAAIAFKGVSIVRQTWNPGFQAGVDGFLVLGQDYRLLLESDQVGAQAFYIDVQPLAAAPELADANFVPPAATVITRVDVVDTKTGAYTASANELVPYDTSGGGFTIDLPAIATIGDEVLIKEVANSAVAAVTIDGNGNTLEAAAGGFAATTTYQIASGYAGWVFDGTRWLLLTVRA